MTGGFTSNHTSNKTSDKKHETQEWRSDQWNTKHSCNNYTHTQVQFQIHGERLVCLTENDIEISDSLHKN